MLRYGLIGCGRISSVHLDAVSHYFKEGSIKLTALCDIVKEKALHAKDSYEKATGDCEVNIYTDVADLLNNEKLDIVAICTPSGLHPIHGIMCAQKGINVLTEKPIGCSLKAADELISACDDAKVKLFVVKQNRLNPTNMALFDALEKGRFGKLYMIQSNVYWYRAQQYYDSDAWRGTWLLDGGAFLNQAVHYADMVQRVWGPIHSIAAFIDHLERNIEAEDTGSAVIKFKNGAIGNMNVTTLTSIGDYEGSFTVIGEKGFVKIGGNCMNRIDKWEFNEPAPEDHTIQNNSYKSTSVYGFGHQAVYGKMIDSLLNNSPIFVDGREGRKSLELVMGIYESSHENKIVVL